MWAEIQPSKSIFDLIVKDGFEEIMKELVNLIKNEMNHFIVKKFVKKMAKHGKNLVEN